MVSIKTQGLGPGLHFATEYAEDCIGIAVTEGDLVLFNVAGAANNTPGEVGSGLVNFIQPVTAGIRFGVHGIAMETKAAGEKVRILLRGRVKAQLGATTAPGLGLVAVNATSNLVAASGTAGASGAGGERVLAVTLETGSATVPTYVIFDGVNGFGSDAA